MTEFLQAGRDTAMNNTRWRWASIAAIVGFLVLWHIRVTGGLPLLALLTVILLAGLSLVYGRLFQKAWPNTAGNAAGLAFQFTCGFFIVNTLLFIMALALPTPIHINVAILAVGALIGIVWLVRSPIAILPGAEELPSFTAIAISGIAATLWCTDAQTPMVLQGGKAVFQTWHDIFIHVREISVFAQAQGLSTIHDIKLAGASAPIYHFASYLFPAVMTGVAGTPALETFSSLQLPVGIFLTGMAAFILMGPLFGRWAGVAATAAVVLLPDAYLQGFGNRYLGYFFISQVNLGMLYGIAAAALAWTFMIDGCNRGKYGLVFMAYVFLVVCLFYKAHLFVANAFLMMVYPCMFFHRLAARWRLLAAVVLVTLFVTVVGLSQNLQRVPVMRIDGSGISGYVSILLNMFDHEAPYRFFHAVLGTTAYPKAVQALATLVMLLACTFGAWLLATAVLLVTQKRLPSATRVFPLLFIANYLVMSMGLALDNRGIGGQDELLNRPLVWAYFTVVAWTAAAAWQAWAPDAPGRRTAVVAIAAVCIAAFITPWHGGRNLQTLSAWSSHAAYERFNASPLCLVESARFIRTHAQPRDLMQDSGGDGDLAFVTTALAERQLYAGKGSFGGKIELAKARLDDFAPVLALTAPAEIEKFVSARGIGWYLLRPETTTLWPAPFLEKSAFACGGYRVFHFDAARQG
jgi:hypothetical protein